jgi:hypothetical protein
MKGSIHLRSDVKYPYWEVYWPMPGNKHEKISRYYGTSERMLQMHPKKEKDPGYDKACKLRAMIQADYERAARGEGSFDIRKYKGQYTDVIPYMQEWLKVTESSIAESTHAIYSGYVNNHLIPFFERHPLQLHEIQKDTIMLMLTEMMAYPPEKAIEPKTRKNIIDCFKTCIRFAYESNRIPKLPGFPKEGNYQIVKKPIKWVTKEELDKIFSFIPREHIPIFTWLRLHWRREGESIALLKQDYDERRDVFVVHRGICKRKLVERVKDGEIHVFPCDEAFKPYLKDALSTRPLSPFMFTCKTSRLEGKRYSREILARAWKGACKKAGINIDIHRGLRTSGASSAINENGWSIEEAQAYGQWSRRETVESFYGRYEIDRLRQLQERGKVLSFPNHPRKDKAGSINKE